MTDEPKYWFPAKRYGWGWGPASTWQGWMVLATYFSLLVVTALLFPPNSDLRLFLALVSVFRCLLVAVCWVEGEPKWRWGEPRV